MIFGIPWLAVNLIFTKNKVCNACCKRLLANLTDLAKPRILPFSKLKKVIISSPSLNGCFFKMMAWYLCSLDIFFTNYKYLQIYRQCKKYTKIAIYICISVLICI